jgi:hypothetical protein
MRAAGQGSPVRLLVELTWQHDERVEGVLTREGTTETQSFSGWLDLMRLLEAAVAPTSRDPPREVMDPGTA